MWFGWNYVIGTVLAEVAQSVLWFLLSLVG